MLEQYNVVKLQYACASCYVLNYTPVEIHGLRITSHKNFRFPHGNQLFVNIEYIQHGGVVLCSFQWRHSIPCVLDVR